MNMLQANELKKRLSEVSDKKAQLHESHGEDIGKAIADLLQGEADDIDYVADDIVDGLYEAAERLVPRRETVLIEKIFNKLKL